MNNPQQEETRQAAENAALRRFAEALAEIPPEVYPAILEAMKAIQADTNSKEE